MATSYFSRIAGSSKSAPIVPSRPVSSLWKSIRLESAVRPAIPQPVRAPRSVVSEASLFPATSLDPIAESTGKRRKEDWRSEGERCEEQNAQRRNARDGVAIAPGAISAPRTQRELTLGLEPDAYTAPNASASRSPQARAITGMRERTESVTAGIAAPVEAPTNDSRQASPAAPTQNQESPVLTLELVPDRQSRSRSLPVMDHGQAARDVFTSNGESQVREKSVHIGKIEVQVLPPPVVRREGPRSRTRLARGYAFWSNG